MELTYPEIGGTKGPMPAGYHHLDRRVRIGTGRGAFEAAADALSEWQMHRKSGLGVDTSTPRAEADTVVVLTLGRIRIPCRVVYLIDSPDRRGFAYGTLPGHPEQGEECFAVEFDPTNDAVFAHIRAFSRPGRWFTALGGPVGRRVQKLFTDRYLAALRTYAA
ncbi:DUF1990 domain-containing protein [Rhodococcus sp. PAMC28707]|uniref:DUF1990 family protein n=1 Tax=unclassified Rhodococcus (in: high G+C Gram-positive bacteria) TaxID=192944 RepID=UPI00109E1D19|nr:MULTISPECIES: DUF1990 domain-containing protein [unclassified Rhodococcus (in: high G+C Gram-positive bacteria)]QCB50844.1 DUF1990 domain-containing protein [Rhodococcus sp. PAMC28705]QCB57464.1 DUF1990 domain-containing protein [Rhodococcus sp. PAMC28707]